MKLILLGLTASGLLCLAFAAWGLYTPAGRIRFDEMAGIIPFASGFVGLVLIGAAGVFAAYVFWKGGHYKHRPETRPNIRVSSLS